MAEDVKETAKKESKFESSIHVYRAMERMTQQ